MELGKMGGANQRFIPLMTNTFQMVANKKALQYLPAGANINALTYVQLRDWAKAMKDATGEGKLGFPAGPKGLMHRYFQASFYPSHTGGIVRTFKNADAEKAWTDFRDLWAYVNPRSTSYGFMEEPLKTGEVWVAFDHTARMLPALNDKPADFVAFPAPSGIKGRGYMPVMVGMAIPKNAADKAAAERVIDHLTKPATQALILKEIGFFPVVKSDLSQLVARRADGQPGHVGRVRRQGRTRQSVAGAAGRQEWRVQQDLYRHLHPHRAAQGRRENRAGRTGQADGRAGQGDWSALLGARCQQRHGSVLGAVGPS
jgi:ABC-type glycerol-3-phosphate transport system substrate-binding protein